MTPIAAMSADLVSLLLIVAGLLAGWLVWRITRA